MVALRVLKATIKYVCMYVCMYVFIYIYYIIWLWPHGSLRPPSSMYACMYVCMYFCMHVCMHVRMYVCMYVCMYVMYEWMNECMYVCMYVHLCQCVCLRAWVCNFPIFSSKMGWRTTALKPPFFLEPGPPFEGKIFGKWWLAKFCLMLQFGSWKVPSDAVLVCKMFGVMWFGPQNIWVMRFRLHIVWGSCGFVCT